MVNTKTNEEIFDVNLYSELVTIYQRLEDELVLLNPSCNTCGTCCNFSKFGHVLYASNIETDFITRNVKVPDLDVSNNICPFLKDNQCSIRDFRTLGCRIFYCNPHYKEVSGDLYEKYHRMLKNLSMEYNIQWKYQPLLNHLAEFKTNRKPVFT